MFVNKKIVINNENIECEYEENKYIRCKENDAINIVDLENMIYIRENDDFLFKIEFKTKKFKYILKENSINLEDDICCSFKHNENIISFSYNLDEETKEIVIQIL